MAPVELISPEGYRVDGRLSQECREIQIEFGTAAGQATFQLGNSIARVTVSGPREAKRQNRRADSAIINVDYRIATFAAPEDQRKKSKEHRASAELGAWLEQAFSQIVVLTAYPKSQIDISVCILANDGGHIACAVNAASLALVDAGVEMRDIVAATTVGFLYQQPCVDLNKKEEFGNPNVLVCALGSNIKKLVLVETDSKMSVEKIQMLLSLAEVGCADVVQELRQALLQRATNVFKIRS